VNAESPMCTGPSIKGHVIILGTARSIAIYERNGERCVADFRDDRGELMSADTWFRFHAGVLRHCGNCDAARQPYTSLTPEMLQKIERLHSESDARQERMLAMPRNAARTVKRCLISLISWTRGLSSKTRRTVG
jgi:hypothetical protein